MNHLIAIEQILHKLEQQGHSPVAKEIRDVQSAATSGSELILAVSHKLLTIQEEKPGAYATIEPEIKRLVEYANSIGLYPKTEK